ncbi:MAG: potassium-transporting ATPase subunit KdpC [Alphaproteobacteria bacterium]|nr:potassium-transporting ATPase subunit KdpC [Alphaproteobacteria bacterium]
MHRVIHHSRHALLMTLLMTALLGVAVPLLFTVVAQLLFPTATHGSLVMRGDAPTGSELLGQEFTQDHYFWGRLSATTPPYNPSASAASNYSMGNAQLLEKANERMRHYPTGEKIPLSLVTSSASGLDPHITPQAAYFQAKRVAKARKVEEKEIHTLIDAHTEAPHLGFIGVPRVNVLKLNMAVDEAHEKR